MEVKEFLILVKLVKPSADKQAKFLAQLSIVMDQPRQVIMMSKNFISLFLPEWSKANAITLLTTFNWDKFYNSKLHYFPCRGY